MSFSFIDKSNIKDAYSESKDYMTPIFEPFDEYERLARNKPHPSIPKHLPRVTEGTLSSTITKQPRRVIQQMPTGRIKLVEDPGVEAVIQVLLDNVIVPNATTGGDMLQKGWEATAKALTYGAQPILSFYTRHGQYFGADIRLPYVKEVWLEKNQLCSGDSNLLFMNQWFTKSQIKGIIAQEQYLEKSAKERGEEYVSTWDLAELDKLIETGETEKQDGDKTPGERDKNGATGGYLIPTAFQEGVGAEFYSFLPGSEDKLVRTKVNKDPRGKMPIEYQYHTVDGGSPLGRGAAEHSGPAQNLLDSYLQMFQYKAALKNAPPIKKWGNLNNSDIKLQPDWIIDMGKNKDNDFQLVDVGGVGSDEFATNFGTLKSILITGANGSDTSIGASAGNPGFSKTQAGVENQKAILGVDDNYIRKQYESAWGAALETMVNIQVAESAGREPLVLEEDQIDKLAAIYPEVRENGGKVELIYDAITTSITFRVDAGTSAGDDDNAQVEILDNLVSKYSENQVLQTRLDEEDYDFSLGEVFDRIVKKSGVQDPEKIIHKLSEEEILKKQQEQQAMMDAQTAAQGEQTTQTGMPATEETVMDEGTAPVPPETLEEPSPELDTSVLDMLGLDEDQKARAIELLSNPDVTIDEVMSELGMQLEEVA